MKAAYLLSLLALVALGTGCERRDLSRRQAEKLVADSEPFTTAHDAIELELTPPHVLEGQPQTGFELGVKHGWWDSDGRVQESARDTFVAARPAGTGAWTVHLARPYRVKLNEVTAVTDDPVPGDGFEDVEFTWTHEDVPARAKLLLPRGGTGKARFRYDDEEGWKAEAVSLVAFDRERIPLTEAELALLKSDEQSAAGALAPGPAPVETGNAGGVARGSEDGQGAALRVGGDVQKPEIVKQVPPRYPEAAKAARVQGIVILEAIINVQGDVEGLKVLRGHPLLDQAAMDALVQWKFKPGTLEGKPVRVIFTLTVNFSLK